MTYPNAEKIVYCELTFQTATTVMSCDEVAAPDLWIFNSYSMRFKILTSLHVEYQLVHIISLCIIDDCLLLVENHFVILFNKQNSSFVSIRKSS